MLLYVRRNRRLIRDVSPGRPPRLSHSSWALICQHSWLLALKPLRCVCVCHYPPPPNPTPSPSSDITIRLDVHQRITYICVAFRAWRGSRGIRVEWFTEPVAFSLPYAMTVRPTRIMNKRSRLHGDSVVSVAAAAWPWGCVWIQLPIRSCETFVYVKEVCRRAGKPTHTLPAKSWGSQCWTNRRSAAALTVRWIPPPTPTPTPPSYNPSNRSSPLLVSLPLCVGLFTKSEKHLKVCLMKQDVQMYFNVVFCCCCCCFCSCCFCHKMLVQRFIRIVYCYYYYNWI